MLTKMLKPLIFAAIVLSGVAATAQELKQSTLPANHPLLGVWRIDLPNGCFEQYTLNANGTKLSESGQERNESIFEISEQPLDRGFYMWTDKITKGNGKPDCGGAITEQGHVAVNFVRVHPSRNRFLLCEKEDMNSCYAEFQRAGGGA
jgi:hypothetical protein